MREYTLIMMNMINYAVIYLKKKNRVLNMNTIKHLRWSALRKARGAGLGGGVWGGGGRGCGTRALR